MARARTPEPENDGLEFDIGPAEVVENRVDLRKKARRTARSDADPVAAAEAAVQELATSFEDWMRNELETLTERWRTAGAAGYAEDAREALFRAAHDLKGQAATLGYPLVGEAAASLCNLLLAGPGAPALPETLVDLHVQAIRAMVREEAREDNDIARRLADRLTSVTDEFLAASARRAA
jgi:chemotaxis protein histidine kinase CheA